MKLISTRTHTTELVFPVEASKDRVLRLLHDPEAFFRVNKAVVKVARDKKDPRIWHVTEKLSTPVGDTTTTFKALWINTPTGFRTKAWANLGVTTTSEWEVSELEPDIDRPAQSTLKINGSLTTPFFVCSFVKAQYMRIHNDTDKRIRGALEDTSGPML